MRLSAEGARLLVKREGVRLKPYRDSAGNWTIGIGAIYDLDGRPVTRNTPPITARQAVELFRRQSPVYAAAVEKAIGPRAALPQASFDALVSLCFNIGRAAFAGSTVARRIRAGELRSAADAILWWDKITVKAGRPFPRRAVAYKPGRARYQGRVLPVEKGDSLNGYVAITDTKCIDTGLVSRRHDEREQYLSGLDDEGDEVSEAGLMTGQVEFGDNPIDSEKSIKYEDLAGMTEAQLRSMLDQPIGMMAACGYKRQIGALASSVFGPVYGEVDDTSPDLGDPIGYELRVVLDDDYPSLAGTEVFRRVKVPAGAGLLERVQAQYRLGQAVLEDVTRMIRSVGGGLA